jgi:hypothetical protein
VTLRSFGKRGLPSPGLIKTKLTGITRGNVNARIRKSFTKREVWEKLRDIGVANLRNLAFHPLRVWQMELAAKVPHAKVPHERNLEIFGNFLQSEKSLIQTFS